MSENKIDLFAHYPEKLKEQFKVYHKDNPHIYRRFVELAHTMKKTGRKYYSSKMLIGEFGNNPTLKVVK